MEDTKRDRLIGAGACLAIAAMLGVVTVWLVYGLVALEKDHERFGDDPFSKADPSGAAMVMVPVAGIAGVIAVGMLVLGVWMLTAKKGIGRP